jgi:DNA-binding transcriptional LysR family regulator
VTAPDSILEMRLSDVAAFLTVQRNSSLTAAARELQVSTSQISKSIHRLEKHVGHTLLIRSPKGVSLSPSAQRLVPAFESALAQVRALTRVPKSETETVLTIASPMYLLEGLLRPLIDEVPLIRLRAIHMAPSVMSSMAVDNVFDVAVTTQRAEFPKAYLVKEVGALSHSLFAHPKLARRLAHQKVTVETLRQIPFILPLQPLNSRLAPVKDSCPLPISERTLGHEVQTIGFGLQLAAISEQLVFGPKIAAHEYVSIGRLIEIQVDGWAVREPVYLVINIDRVSSKVAKQITQVVEQTICSY